jgi:hypothetical protein
VLARETTGAEAQDPPAGARTLAGLLSRLAWLLFLVALPAAVYFFYVLAQFEAIQARDLRVLGETAEAIENIAETAAGNLNELVEVTGAAALTTWTAKDAEGFAADFFNRQAAINPPTGTRDSCLPGGVDAGVLPRFFDYNTLSFAIACPGDATPERPTETLALLDLNGILGRVPSTSTLSLVVVVTREGKVVAEHTPQPAYRLAPGAETDTGLRISDITALRDTRASADPMEVEALTSQTALRHVMIAGVAYELACQPLRLPLRQWVRTPAREPAGLSVCGFVAEAEVRREALQVAPTLLLMLSGLTALGLLSWPLLKVLAMAPTERLRTGDVYFVLLSSLAIVIFCIVAWRDSALYLSLREAGFTALRTMAAEVDNTVRAELREMHEQLCTYDSELKTYSGVLRPETDRDHKDLFLPLEDRRRDGDFPGFSQPRAVYDSFFFMLDSAGGDSGQQVIKGTVFPANTPYLNLSSREYFSRVSEGRGWPSRVLNVPAGTVATPDANNNKTAADDARQSSCRDKEAELYVQTARSLTTGEFFAALSMPSQVRVDGDRWSDDPATAGRQPGLVAAILGPMQSFRHAALSPGLDLSVIDSSGAAVFHADSRRARAERVFRDEGVGQRLRSAVNAGVEQCFSGNYRGQPRLLCVRPMQGLPWNIVASLRQEPIVAANIEVLASAASYSLAYLGVLVVLTALFVLSETYATKRSGSAERSRLSPRWIWPYLLPAREYWFWNGVGVVAIAAICLASLIFRSSLPLLLCPLPLAAALLFTVTRRGTRLGGRLEQEGLASLAAYSASAFLLWILVAVLPATGIFNAAMESELPRAVIAEQFSFRRGLEERACAIADDYKRFAFDDSSAARADAIKASVDANRGVYRLELFGSDGTGAAAGEDSCAHSSGWRGLAGSRWQATLEAFVADFKPLYNETATAVRYIGLPEAERQSGTPTIERCEDVIRVRFPARGACGAPLSAARYGKVPFPGLPDIGLWPIALALLGVLLVFVRYTGHQLFFGSIAAVPSRDPSRAQRGAGDSAHIDGGTEPAGTSDWYEDCFCSVCNEVDRLVLYQVATTGFANPKQRDSVRRLLERGLLLRDPALAIADEGFRRYIRDHHNGRDLEAAISAEGRFDSRRLRWILATALAIIVAFLTVTQPDVVEVWIQFIVAASAGAAALLKVSSSVFGNVDK